MPAQHDSQRYPRVLHVDTTFAPENTFTSALWQAKIDYRALANTPAWWRNIEQKLRLDIDLARKAIALSKDFDVILCGSEKVGIPLALLGCPKPIVTIVHHLVPRRKAQLIKVLSVTKHWARVGVYSKADAEFIAHFFGYPLENTFNYASTPMGPFDPPPLISHQDGILLSAGASSRDYPTLVAALAGLPGISTEIYASSRFEDAYRGGQTEVIPEWVHFMPDTPHAQLAHRMTTHAWLVAVPIVNTTQYSAGCSAIMEASAAGKAVVATRTMGSVDYIQDGITGFLVPPGDSDALREAIRKLWQDPQLAHRMGLAGRKFVEQYYDPVKVSEEVRQAIMDAYQSSQAH